MGNNPNQRKTPLFREVPTICRRAAMMYSLLGVCKVLGKNPEKWLAHTLKHTGSTKPEHLHRLLPEEWTEQFKTAKRITK